MSKYKARPMLIMLRSRCPTLRARSAAAFKRRPRQTSQQVGGDSPALTAQERAKRKTDAQPVADVNDQTINPANGTQQLNVFGWAGSHCLCAVLRRASTQTPAPQ